MSEPEGRGVPEASGRENMTTFAALGDSITLGVGDPVRRAGSWAWRGWAALLAEGTREPNLHILASCGARFADVERDQLPLVRHPFSFGFIVHLVCCRLPQLF